MKRNLPFRRAIEMPVAFSRSNPQRLRLLSGSFCQAADIIVLVAAVIAVVVLPDFRHGPRSLGQFLELRLSLRSIFIAAMCLSTWRMILVSVGIYSPMRRRSVTDYLFRYVIAVNSCAGVVGLIELVLRPGRDVWGTVEVFWVVAIVVTAALRIGLVLFDRMKPPSPIKYVKSSRQVL